jgi:predicted component of type VI protein secretion system
MDLRLVVRTVGKLQGRSIPINRSPFLIGRDPVCQLRPGSSLVSGRHCALTAHGGKTFVQDLGSTNGTFVNGERVQAKHELRQGDVLLIGPLEFEVRMEATAPVGQPTPLPPAKESLPNTTANAAILRSLEAKSSLLLHDPGIESDGVPAGKTLVDVSLSASLKEPESEVEVDDEPRVRRAARGGFLASLRRYFRRPAKR